MKRERNTLRRGNFLVIGTETRSRNKDLGRKEEGMWMTTREGWECEKNRRAEWEGVKKWCK